MPDMIPEELPAGWVAAAEAAYSMNGAGLVRNMIAAVVPLIRADERERIRLAVFGCTRCGAVHEPRRTGRFAATYASPEDGHPWSPAYVSQGGGLADMLAGLLDGPH